MLICICGSRDFQNYDLMVKVVDKVINQEGCTDVVIINGGAKGADTLAQQYAKQRNFNCITVNADWNKYGKSAGSIRNIDMATRANLCIAFWDGVSRGTKHMLNVCENMGIKTHVINYNTKMHTWFKNNKGNIPEKIWVPMTFRGAYAFLSNFYPCEINYEGITYPSVEHAYQAAKTDDKSEKLKISQMFVTDAKRYGRMVKMKPDFDGVHVMGQLLNIKFNKPELKKALKTIKRDIVEGNTWHDNFWGVCTCDVCVGVKGQNTLGKLLMEIRDK